MNTEKYPPFPQHNWDWQLDEISKHKYAKRPVPGYINPIRKTEFISSPTLVQYYGHPVWQQLDEPIKPHRRISRLYTQNLQIIDQIVTFNIFHRNIWQIAVQLLVDSSIFYPEFADVYRETADVIVDQFNDLHFKDLAGAETWKGIDTLDNFATMPHPKPSTDIDYTTFITHLVQVAIEWFAVFDSHAHRSIYAGLVQIIDIMCREETGLKTYTLAIYNYYRSSTPINSIDDIELF